MRPQWSEKSEPNKVGLCNHFCSHMHTYNPRISNLLAKFLRKSYRIYLATVHDSIVFLKFVLYSTLPAVMDSHQPSMHTGHLGSLAMEMKTH